MVCCAKLGFCAVNLCWWYVMGVIIDLIVMLWLIYFVDGKKEFDCYMDLLELYDWLIGLFGEFLLFIYWGLMVSIVLLKWIVDVAKFVFW